MNAEQQVIAQAMRSAAVIAIRQVAADFRESWDGIEEVNIIGRWIERRADDYERVGRIDAVLDALIPEALSTLGTHSLEDVAHEFGVDLDDDACDECHGVDDHFTDCKTLTDQEGKS